MLEKISLGVNCKTFVWMNIISQLYSDGSWGNALSITVSTRPSTEQFNGAVRAWPWVWFLLQNVLRESFTAWEQGTKEFFQAYVQPTNISDGSYLR